MKKTWQEDLTGDSNWAKQLREYFCEPSENRNACKSYNNRLITRVVVDFAQIFGCSLKLCKMKKTWQEDLTGDSNRATKLMLLNKKFGEN